MYDHVQEFSFANIDKFSTASIVTRLTTDVTNVQMAFQMCIRIAARAPGMLIFALIASFGIDAQLSLVFLGVLPILGIGLYILIRAVYPIFNRVFKTYDKLNNVVQENLYGIRVVKSYNRQDHEVEKFKKTSGKIYQDFSKANGVQHAAHAVLHVSEHDPNILVRSQSHSGQRKRCGYRPLHRRADQSDNLHHADTYEPSDDLHDIRHADHGQSLGRSYC